MNFDIDFSKIPAHRRQTRPVHPIELFQASAVTDGNINDLWLAQGDALREWHEHRADKDVAVVLNTGAGKTLVGLLIAQSLVHETQRQVVYACSSIQLVEQTAEKARGYGLPVTTYHGNEFSPDGQYQRAEAPCVTTYQALFNGKTRFRSDDISAVVFDDAHTAEHILRDHFSLSIVRSEMEEAHSQIAALFQPYHQSVGSATSYAEAIDGGSPRLFLVPPFEVRRNVGELRRILLGANLSQHRRTMFSWEHIRDHEDLCCLLISNSEVTLTPPTVPVSALPYFNQDVRRVYLSATLSAPDAFVRAFGREPDRFVSPSTTAGECERLILVPSLSEAVEDDVDSGMDIVRDKKALILVPTYLRSGKWSSVATIPYRENVPEAVSAFRDATTPEKMILAARYDGIDLPGDTCRMLVIDDLPTGLGPLERFQWEWLHMQNSYRSTVASRIVQSFGRISRGMSDHGVVVLTGRHLVDWIRLPRNRLLLPSFLRRQLELGENVSEFAEKPSALVSAANACLSRESGWVKFYNDRMRDDALGPDLDEADTKKVKAVALAEAKFGEALWNRDFQRSVPILQDALDDAFDISQSTGAWLTLWLGFATEMMGDAGVAREHYAKAHAIQRNVPPPRPEQGVGATPVPAQFVNVQQQMRVGLSGPSTVEIPKSLIGDLAALKGSGSAAQTEEALRCLGQYLGLESTRPDKELGTGPDVLWVGEDGYAVCMEAKTDKQPNSTYSKDHVGQLHNHVQWVKDNYDVAEIIPVFVGPLSPASDQASPSPDMRVAELRLFEELGQRLISALEDVAAQTMPLSLGRDLNEVMNQRGLNYPDVVSSLEMTVLQQIPSQ